jgi:ATP-dependent Clp protease ATP-binding subunit ClpC
VVLLDEIEKAHWSVFDALLAALGEGRLTDASGRSADFRNAIVIMTSNLGATRAPTTAVGFSPSAAGVDAVESRYVEEAEKFFRPEFFNRIDRIVVFHALGAETVRRIARRELALLLEREGIVRRGLRIEVDESVVESVAIKGLHPRYGARPLQREIERSVIQPLARLLVKRAPGEGDFVRVHLADGAIAVDVERVTEQPRAVGRRERRSEVDDAQFAKAKRTATAFVKEVADDQASVFVAEVRPVVSELLGSTHRPSFWDDADRARSTLQRIYRLEQVIDRFDSLGQRAFGLVEMAKRVEESRDRSRVKEIPQAIEEMRDRLLVLRLELAAAAMGAEGGGARIRVIPVGPGSSEWARQLRAMYESWADRTGRGVRVAEGGSGELELDGLATFDLLAGETGLHRQVRPDRTEALARVVVATHDGGAADEADPGIVVRVYEEGKRRVVRDPRTDIRESHVESVLADGRIDSFLIAWLRRQQIERAPVPDAGRGSGVE